MSTERIETGAEMLARIQPRKRVETTKICLRPDLLDAWEDAQTELAKQKVEDHTGERLSRGVSPAQKRLAKKVVDLEKQITDTEARFTFENMNKDEWQAICDQHPPRKGNQLDLYAGHNRDAVLDAMVRKCMVSPAFDDCTKPDCVEHADCGSWQALVKACNPSEWEELRRTTQSVNRSVTETPFSVLASQTLSKRASGSAQQPDSE